MGTSYYTAGDELGLRYIVLIYLFSHHLRYYAPIDMPPGWVRGVDKETGRVYYRKLVISLRMLFILAFLMIVHLIRRPSGHTL